MWTPKDEEALNRIIESMDPEQLGTMLKTAFEVAANKKTFTLDDIWTSFTFAPDLSMRGVVMLLVKRYEMGEKLVDATTVPSKVTGKAMYQWESRLYKGE